MKKKAINWAVTRLAIIYSGFYLVGWFGTLNANILEWGMFEETFQRTVFAVVFLIVTGMVLFLGYDEHK